MINILLVDDHEILRDGIRNILETEHDLKIVGETDNGRTAIKLCGELKPDIIIMDLIMQNMNGMEATRQIINENADVKVIALTMHTERSIILQAFKSGVSGYVLKDSSRTDLLIAIRNIYLGHRYTSPYISDILVEEFSNSLNGNSNFNGNPLTGRENEILQMITEGKSVKQIAKELYISHKTVASHRANIMEKLNIHNLPMLTKYAIGAGITSAEK